MKRLNIAADDKIPFLKEFFSNLGSLKILPPKEICQKNIKDCDILLVRTVTQVNQELLKMTKIKIVGSMTSGIDHIDRYYLRKMGIKLLYAPGSNANSVAEYVFISLLVLAKRKNIDLNGEKIGIIGYGNIGKKVAQKFKTIGMKLLLNDPPLYARTKNKIFLSLEKIFNARIITLHIPLTYGGNYPTFHFVDEEFLSKIKPGTILINTSRGKVINEQVLLKYLNKLGGLVLDVWEYEPAINAELLKFADIGTPHIAGYSLDGKLNATFTVYYNLCKLLNIDPEISKEEILPLDNKIIVIKSASTDSVINLVKKAVLKVYNPLVDDQALRQIFKIKPEMRKEFFESLRQNYPVRREFFNYKINLNGHLKSYPKHQKLIKILKTIGFQV